MVGSESLAAWPLEKIKYVHLEMGQQCNVRCIMCYQTDFSPSSRMPDVVWSERLIPAYRIAKRLVIAGGEPTVLPNCRALLEMVARDYPNLELDTVTNGMRFEGLWEEVFLRQGAFVNFSINAVTPSLYRRIVQYGDYERVIGNILRLVRRKTETGSHLTIRISTVMMDCTVDELPRFIQWAVDHGLEQVLVSADFNGRIKATPREVVQERITQAYEIADRNPAVKVILLNDFDWYYAGQNGIAPVRPRGTFQRDRCPCPTPFDTLYVNSDGTVKPCCKSWYVFGNLVTSPLQDVWQSKAAHRFRRRMTNLDFRDCMVLCDANRNPADRRVADARKAWWLMRRDPRSAVKKGLRRLGLSSAQVKEPLSP